MLTTFTRSVAGTLAGGFGWAFDPVSCMEFTGDVLSLKLADRMCVCTYICMCVSCCSLESSLPMRTLFLSGSCSLSVFMCVFWAYDAKRCAHLIGLRSFIYIYPSAYYIWYPKKDRNFFPTFILQCLPRAVESSCSRLLSAEQRWRAVSGGDRVAMNV